MKAIVVLRDGRTSTPTEIIAFSRERLAGFKCPKSIDFVERLPRNAAGKVLRRELRKPYWANAERQVG